MAKVHLNSKVPQAGALSRNIKDVQIPAVDNPDGTVSVVAQPIYPIDPNTDPVTYTMPCTVAPGAIRDVVGTTALIAAGATLYTCPVGKKAVALSMVTDTTTTATVGNRFLYYLISNATPVVMVVGPLSAAVVASKVAGYDVGFNGMLSNTTVRKKMAAASSTDVQVTTATSLVNMLAGDTIKLDDTADVDIADSVQYAIRVVEYPA